MGHLSSSETKKVFLKVQGRKLNFMYNLRTKTIFLASFY